MNKGNNLISNELLFIYQPIMKLVDTFYHTHPNRVLSPNTHIFETWTVFSHHEMHFHRKKKTLSRSSMSRRRILEIPSILMALLKSSVMRRPIHHNRRKQRRRGNDSSARDRKLCSRFRAALVENSHSQAMWIKQRRESGQSKTKFSQNRCPTSSDCCEITP